jgi:hypothetical protein
MAGNAVQAFITELETSARSESKRMTNHSTPQLSRMDLANHCAAFPGLSLLNIRAIHQYSLSPQACSEKETCRKAGTNLLVSPTRQRICTSGVDGKKYLTKHNTTALQHPPYRR